MRRYRVLLPLQVHTESGSYGQGDEFEYELTPADEAENVNSGLLEIVPSRYKVIGPRRVLDTDPDEEFEAALLQEQEAALVAAGHIERVAEKPAPKPRRKKKEE